jgi:predicted kinase
MSRPHLIILVGIPGSGKTTYAKKYIREHPRTRVHLSSDKIREELYGDESAQGNPAEVFSIMQKRAIEALNNGYDVIYDATNITRKDRASIISICPKFVQIECHIIWLPIYNCINRDATRKRTVGQAVIDKMLKRFQAPYYDEGIDVIKVISHNDCDQTLYHEKCFNDMKIPHDNPHHTLNIFEHCSEAAKYILDLDCTNLNLIAAAEMHDIGKPYVKAFVDGKGNPCDIAHYYQHQCVGAWMVYGCAWGNPYVAWLISTHMDPFLNTKYWRNLPASLKRDVDLLHEADLNAH